MAVESTAATLQDKLTEYGLVRTLSQQDVSPELVRLLSIDEAARLLQRGTAVSGLHSEDSQKS